MAARRWWRMEAAAGAGGDGGGMSPSSSSATARHGPSSAAPALSLPPGLLVRRRFAVSRPPPLLLLAGKPWGRGRQRRPAAKLPSPSVALPLSPAAGSYAFEERGDAILHPLSPPQEFCLLHYLICWRCYHRCTVPTQEAKLLLPLLLESV
jgi:hypothetical protein